MLRLHRTLNLMLLVFWFFLMPAATKTTESAWAPRHLIRDPVPQNSLVALLLVASHLSIAGAFSVPAIDLAGWATGTTVAGGSIERIHGRTERTLGVLSPADLDELLDVGDFGRHGGRICVCG